MACIVLFCRAPEESKAADGKPSLQQSPKLNTPVLRAHVDYSATSGPRRLQDTMKDEAEQLGKTPFCILQVQNRPPRTGPRICSTSIAFKHCDCFYSCCSCHDMIILHASLTLLLLTPSTLQSRIILKLAAHDNLKSSALHSYPS